MCQKHCARTKNVYQMKVNFTQTDQSEHFVSSDKVYLTRVNLTATV